MTPSPQPTRLHRKSASSKRFRSVTFPPASSPIEDLLLLPPSLTIPSWTLRTQDFDANRQGLSRQIQTASGYPSPPLTDPCIQANISLPAWLSPESDLSPIETGSFGGILDSPPVMYREPLKRSAPPSPPPTILTSTSSLPLTESHSFNFSPLDDIYDTHYLGYDSNSESPLLETFTPSSESSCSTLSSPSSPTSPELMEWQHSFTSPSVHSSVFTLDNALLPHSTDTSPTSPIDDHRSSLHKRSLHSQEPLSSKRPLLSPLNISDHYELLWRHCQSPKEIHPPSDLEPIDLESTTFPTSPYPDSPGIETPLETGQEQGQGDASTDDNDGHNMQWKPHTSTYRQSSFLHPSSPSLRNNSLLEFDDDPYDMDIDIPEEPPESPALRSYTALPDDDNSLYDPQPSHPNLDEDTLDTAMLSPTGSPSPALLSLPGAEIDEDLIPFDLAPTNPPDRDRTPPPYSNPLLIMGDDYPIHSSQSQRSPSPEPCAALDVGLVMNEFSEDDEIRQICGLLKRTKDAERAARQMEMIVEEEEKINGSIMGGYGGAGTMDVWSRVVDAKRKTKRRREKVREVATLLRLQLVRRGWKVGKDGSGKMSLIPITPPGPVSASLEESTGDDGTKLDQHQRAKYPPRKQRITSPHQLLVKMIMDRHEPRHGSRVGGPGALVGKKLTSPLAKGTSASKFDANIHDMGGAVREDVPRTILGVDVHDDLGSENQEMDDLDLDLGLEPLPSS